MLTDLPVPELVRQLRARTISSLEVVNAFIERSERVDRALNAVVVPLFEQAQAAARSADQRATGGDELRPMHGVPFTVKECFDVEGTSSTVGVRALGSHVATRDAALVSTLREAGAILLGKTNLPQLMWFNEADNPLFGRTNNPWDLARGPGGSSGGEAAIIAAGGSPLGFGTDSGGSIRTPAHFCGVHTIKPTSSRLSLRGTADERLMAGQEAIIDQPGPFACTVEGLELSLATLVANSPFDPAVPPVPWCDPSAVGIAGLRVGVFTDAGPVSPAPAVSRAVHEATRCLEAEGAHVQAFSPPGLAELKRTYDRIFSADGGAGLEHLLGESELDWRISRILELQRALGPLSAAGWCELVAERSRYRDRFVELLDEQKLDALICPPYPLAALPHGASGNVDLEAAEVYTAVFNFVGLPAGVVAGSRVRAGEEFGAGHSGAIRAVDEGSAGLPVGVQVAARHWREDVVLSVMRALEAHFRALADYPSVPHAVP